METIFGTLVVETRIVPQGIISKKMSEHSVWGKKCPVACVFQMINGWKMEQTSIHSN